MRQRICRSSVFRGLLPLLLSTDATREAFVHEENRGCANFGELEYVEAQAETLQECLDLCAARSDCAESFSSRQSGPMRCLLFSAPGCSLEFSTEWDSHKKDEEGTGLVAQWTEIPDMSSTFSPSSGACFDPVCIAVSGTDGMLVDTSDPHALLKWRLEGTRTR